MKPWTIILASSNQHKIKEIKDAFAKKGNKDFDLVAMDHYEKGKNLEIIEDQKTFYGNALIKAKKTYEALNPFFDNRVLGVLSDDSGLCVLTLNGEPGVFSARYAQNDKNKKNKEKIDAANRQKLVEKLQEKQFYQKNKKEIFSTKAYFETTMVFFSKREKNKETILYATGKLYGNIIAEQKGILGFGYDPLFVPEKEKRTLAQMTLEEKNAISHRTKSLEIMTKEVQGFLKRLSII